MELSSEQVLAWRMRRQLLERPGGMTTADVVERLCGVLAVVTVTLFPKAARVTAAGLKREASWIAALTGTTPEVTRCTTGS